MSERDIYLTEAMGELKQNPYTRDLSFHDFSTWAGFGKLWEWAIEQKWLEDFLNIADVGNFIKCSSGDTFDIQKEFINPERFAKAVYEYLKGVSDER